MNKTVHLFYGLRDNNNKIPKGIVKNYQKNLDLNTDFRLEKWNGSRCYEFVKSHFPDYVNIYNDMCDYRYKCDLVRLMVLCIHGGLYMDIDCECLCSVDKMSINDDTELCVVFNANGTEIFNSLIYVKNTENEFIRQCIIAYVNVLSNKNIGACPVMKTVFAHMYPNYGIGINDETITVHQEQNEKDLKDCQNREEFWNSFYIYNAKKEKMIKSRYDAYYDDRKNPRDVTDFA